MLTVEEREAIRRAYYVEHKSVRAIARELHHARATVEQALESAEPTQYTQHQPRPAPVLGPYHAQIQAWVAENATLPRKQRYTSHRIYELLRAAGYPGAESTVRGYIGQLRRAQRAKREVYVPLAFAPGEAAQVDWGVAEVVVAGHVQAVQLFVMELCYSRRTFVMAFPTQRQEAFFLGHVQAFHFFQGVPQVLIYDNLKAAVYRILAGQQRQEQARFVQLRSHYLFESRFCTPGQGHEKGGVEGRVGFVRRNYLVPRPAVADYPALNAYLAAACAADDARQVQGQPQPIGAAWAAERPHLRPLPPHDFACAVQREVTLNGYSQVVFETNRYSVPTDQAYRQVVLQATPFEVTLLHGAQVLARHPRCYDREQDIWDPLHYLPLLEQRPGALAHARPLQQWRTTWPPVYERLLTHLQQRWPEGQGTREFVRILRLHQEFPAPLLEQAVAEALRYASATVDSVRLCLQALTQPALPAPVDLAAHPALAQIAAQGPDLQQYERLLSGGLP